MRDNRALAQFRDLAPGEESFREAVLAGLSARQKSIPCRFLYDDRGSELFEAICETPEYYPTRTETAILETYAGENVPARPVKDGIENAPGSYVKARV